MLLNYRFDHFKVAPLPPTIWKLKLLIDIFDIAQTLLCTGRLQSRYFSLPSSHPHPQIGTYMENLEIAFELQIWSIQSTSPYLQQFENWDFSLTLRRLCCVLEFANSLHKFDSQV